MHSQKPIFKPTGKSNAEILRSLIAEACAVVDWFEVVSSRHADELKAYREANPWNTGNLDLRDWIAQAALKNLLELAEPEKLDYDFSVFRRQCLQSIDSGEGIDVNSAFIRLFGLSGIRPLYLTILGANTSQELVYTQSLNPRELPVFDAGLFDFLELDVVALKLYIGSEKFYGFERLLEILEGGSL